ncbi:MAG: CBS domain-containing protein [Nitrospirales bacterium]|nr:CBS domain-containing protein [Nitrospirales bacterium]
MKLEQDLRAAFIENHPLQAARYLEGLPAKTTGDMLQTMEPENVAPIMEYFLPGAAANVLRQYTPIIGAEILGRLSTGSARAILRQFDLPTQKKFLEHLPSQTAAFLRRTIHLSEHTAGSLADPHVLTLPPDITVGQGLQRIAQVTNQAMYYLYIVDHRTILCGVVLMKELLAAETSRLLSSIMNPHVKSIPASASAQDSLLHPAWAQYDSLPVIDSDKTFIGAIRHRTLRKFLLSQHGEYQPAYLSDALLQLWEAYSLSGIGLMTALGDALATTTPPAPAREEQETP